MLFQGMGCALSPASTRPRRLVAVGVALAAVTLAGCGGGDDESDQTHYSRELTVPCLRGVAKPQKPRDYISRGAKEGAVRMIVANHEVIVAFAATVDEAKEMAEKFKQFGGKVVQKGTAVVRYSGEIAGGQESAIEGCLKARAQAAPS